MQEIASQGRSIMWVEYRSEPSIVPLIFELKQNEN